MLEILYMPPLELVFGCEENERGFSGILWEHEAEPPFGESKEGSMIFRKQDDILPPIEL